MGQINLDKFLSRATKSLLRHIYTRHLFAYTHQKDTQYFICHRVYYCHQDRVCLCLAKILKHIKKFYTIHTNSCDDVRLVIWLVGWLNGQYSITIICVLNNLTMTIFVVFSVRHVAKFFYFFSFSHFLGPLLFNEK